jgi:hypothetical protein
MVKYKDKNGTSLKVGDWVLYKWWSVDKGKYEYFCNPILRLIPRQNICVHPAGGVSSSHFIEKMPNDEKLRNELLFLRQLEG